jgi:hypothetical protein
LRKVPVKEYDKSALVFLFMITLCMISRTVSVFIRAHDDENIDNDLQSHIVDLINMLTDLSYWILLDLFVLEMKTVKDIVSANSTT